MLFVELPDRYDKILRVLEMLLQPVPEHVGRCPKGSGHNRTDDTVDYGINVHHIPPVNRESIIWNSGAMLPTLTPRVGKNVCMM